MKLVDEDRETEILVLDGPLVKVSIARGARRRVPLEALGGAQQRIQSAELDCGGASHCANLEEEIAVVCRLKSRLKAPDESGIKKQPSLQIYYLGYASSGLCTTARLAKGVGFQTPHHRRLA
jgi:hypothetical protein